MKPEHKKAIRCHIEAMIIMLLIATAVFFISKAVSGSDAETVSEAASYGYNSGNYYLKESVASSSDSEAETDYGEKISYSADIRLETKNFDDTVSFIENAVIRYNSTILSGSVYENGGYRSGYWTIAVPSEKYQDFISDSRNAGDVTSFTSGQENLTENYIDVSERLKSLYAEKDAVEKLIEKAEDIDTILIIEDKIYDIEYEINSLEASKKRIENITDNATVTISVSEVEEYTPETFGEKISNAVSSSIEEFKMFIENVAVTVIYAAPYALMIAVFAIVAFAIIKRILKKKKEKKKNEPETEKEKA